MRQPFLTPNPPYTMKKLKLLICLLMVMHQIASAQFDTLFNLNKTTSHFIKDDTIWLTARSGVVKRLCSTGEVLKTYTYKNSPIPPYQMISSVFVDHQHRMWLYLEEKAIVMLDGTTWTSWSQQDASWVLSASSGGKIVVDDAGIPWIAAAGRSPMFYKDGMWQQPPDPFFLSFSPSDMKIGPDGNLWTSSSYGGLYNYDGTSWKTIVDPTVIIPAFANAPGGGFYTCQNFPSSTSAVYYYPGIGMDSVLIGTLNSLSRRIAVSPSGRIWISGEFPEGIAYFENGQLNYLAESIPVSTHLTLSVDSAGRLWDTKDFYGTAMHDGVDWQHIWTGPVGFEQGAPGKDGSIWFGYLNTLSHYFPATGQTEYVYLKPADKLFDSNMVGLKPGVEGTFYAATQLGQLAWYDGNGNFKKTTETDGASHAWNSYVRMAVDPSDNLYYHGWDVFSDLIRYNARTGQRSTIVKNHNTDPNIPFNEQYFFDVDKRGRVWMNTDKGMVYWANGGWKTFFEPSPALDYLEYMIAGVNGVWQYSSIGQTLQYFDGKDTTSWYMPLNVANGEQIFNLYVDSRNWLWCNTNSRLLCLQGYTWKIYDPALGTFPGLGIGNMFEDAEGNMWFITGDVAIRLNLATGRVNGQLLDDRNLDCQIQATEPGIGGYRIVYDNGINRVETIADKSGKFSVSVPPGVYTTSVIPFSNLGQSCQSGFLTTVLQNQTTALQIPVQTTLFTPQMSVRISTPFTRRCSNATYYVNVCNAGNLAADSAFVTVQLPLGLSFVEATVPSLVDSTGLIRFDLGYVNFDTCLNFSFTTKVGCDDSASLGQSICVTAHVFPDSLPSLGVDAWTGATIVVNGRCSTNLVRFEVKNEGKSSTSSPLKYQVVKDAYLHESGALSLFSKEIKSFEYPADGSTWRFSIEQETGHPSALKPSIALEGCSTAGSGQERSTGFVAQVENSTGNPFEYTDCQSVVGSFDPNDKQTQPKGWGKNHQIPPGQVLRYTIQFQNTGTDTAFTVVVRDTFDTHLNWGSFQAGLSSHPYSLDLDSVHRTVAFIFNNILLPDSNRNEAASHGFIQFTIQPKLSTPLGTIIQNQASIYFDFNAAVQTGMVQHTVDTGFIRPKPLPPIYNPESPISFTPNPAGQITWMSGKFFEPGIEHLVKIYDSKGREVRNDTMTDFPFLLEKGSLPSGVYQVSVWAKGRRVAIGQVVFL